MNSKNEVIYDGKVYTVFFKYESGYLEIKENTGLNTIKLVDEREVKYKLSPAI